jgi:flagellar biosynthesis protein FliR
MLLTSIEISTLLSSWFLPFVRIAAMFSIVPIYSSTSIPVRAKLIAVILITAVIAPTIPAIPEVDAVSFPGMMMVVQQMIIGFAMGFIFPLVFAVFIMGGHSVAMSMGLGFASMVDPDNGVQVPVVSQLLLMVVTQLFLVAEGHLLIIQILAESFISLPIGGGLVRHDFWQVASWGSKMFLGGVIVALPVMTGLLLINVAFGVVTKAAPQMNIFAVGFPVTILVGFIILYISLPNLLPHLFNLIDQAVDLVHIIVTKAG